MIKKNNFIDKFLKQVAAVVHISQTSPLLAVIYLRKIFNKNLKQVVTL